MTVVKAVSMEENGYYPQARYNAAGASAKQMMAVTEDATADIGVMPGEIFIEAQVSSNLRDGIKWVQEENKREPMACS